MLPTLVFYRSIAIFDSVVLLARWTPDHGLSREGPYEHCATLFDWLRRAARPPDSDPFSDAEFRKNLACLSMRKRGPQVESPILILKRTQFFIRTHDETLPVVAMRVNDPN
jgi:hypothetical protein